MLDPTTITDPILQQQVRDLINQVETLRATASGLTEENQRLRDEIHPRVEAQAALHPSLSAPLARRAAARPRTLVPAHGFQSRAGAHLLATLSKHIRESTDADTLLATVVRLIGQHLQVMRCYFAEIDEPNDRWFVRHEYHTTPPSIVGAYRISHYPSVVVERVRSGRVLIAEDTKTDPRSSSVYAAAYAPLRVRAHVIVPFLRDGQWISNLVVATDTPRRWPVRDIRLLETVAQLVWLTVEKLRADVAVRASEFKLQAALDGALLGVWSWDPSTNRTGADRRVLELFGIDPDVGANNLAPVFEQIHPEDRSLVWGAMQEAIRPHGYYNAEFRVLLPDGQVRWLAGTGRARWEQDRRVTAVYGVNLDITERKRAEQHTQFLLELDAVVAQLTDPDTIEQESVTRLGSYLDVVQCSFAHIAGTRSTVLHCYRRDGIGLLGEYDLNDFFSPDGLAQLARGTILMVDDVGADARTAAMAGQYGVSGIGAFLTTPVIYQGRWIGALTLISSRPRAWRADEGQVVHEVAARVWPLIEQARAQAALRASEARLQVLYEQEQAARAQAEAANRLKDEFLATVSHELRTPLTAFLGYAQMLQSRKRDEAYTARTIDKMVRSARSQAQIIEDLLDVSRIVSGKLQIHPEPIDLSSVVQAALDTVRPALEAKELELRVDVWPGMHQIIGDANRLQQVVWNLVANAVKFTSPGGSITVQMFVEDRQMVLVVSDTGQGIGPDFLPFVFDRFRQAEGASNRLHSGLGLGLAIVRHLVELHGGTVQAESAGEGRGATFTVRLPRLPASAPLAQGDEASSGVGDGGVYPFELRGLRVLVVDDQPEILEVLQDMIAPCGTLVKGCTTAREALALVQSWRPDVLVSDVGMPIEDGCWLIREVRALHPADGGAVPAIALTAYTQLEVRMRVLAAGFDQYVPKPVEPSELRAVIASLVRRGEAEQP